MYSVVNVWSLCESLYFAGISGFMIEPAIISCLTVNSIKISVDYHFLMKLF